MIMVNVRHLGKSAVLGRELLKFLVPGYNHDTH